MLLDRMVRPNGPAGARAHRNGEYPLVQQLPAGHELVAAESRDHPGLGEGCPRRRAQSYSLGKRGRALRARASAHGNYVPCGAGARLGAEPVLALSRPTPELDVSIVLTGIWCFPRHRPLQVAGV